MNINLLAETIDELFDQNKTESDVMFVTCEGRSFSWDDFKKIADFEYDNSYGGNEIKLSLKVVGLDWWLERHEYDGSEWWEYKTLPKQTESVIPTKEFILE